MLLILRSSKTHTIGDQAQSIKIASTPIDPKKSSKKEGSQLCPFKLLKEFIEVRPVGAQTDTEQFFIWRDRSPVQSWQVATMLQAMIKCIGLNENNYSFHSFRAGRAGDMLRLGLSVETIKKIGCWKSNAVFAYLKD